MHGALPCVAYASLYRDVPPSVCLFSHFGNFRGIVVLSSGVLKALTRGILSFVFDVCFFAQFDTTHHFICLIKTNMEHVTQVK